MRTETVQKRIGLGILIAAAAALPSSRALILSPEAFASAITDCVESQVAEKSPFTPPTTINLAKLEATEQILNDRLSARFPSLAIMLKDPDQFFDTMNSRFAEQKRLHPEDPYGFDYSEISLPLVRDIRANLARKTEELTRILESKRNPTLLGLLSLRQRKYKIPEIETALRYLGDLSAEADGYLKSGSVTYENTIRFCTFYGRAIGHFDQRNSTLFQRNFLKLDHKLGGYKQLPIQQEYSMYLNHDFSIFQKNVSFTEHAGSREIFEKVAFDKDQLKTLMIPTSAELNYDILQRLMSREKINLLGVAYEPILAEGFLRPAGPFWQHDIRHEAAKYFGKSVYYEEHPGIEEHPEKVRILNLLMDQWYYDLFNEMERIPDKNLREAVKLLVFNHNHDLGYPFAPSDYLNWKGDKAVYLLYFSIKASGQDVANFNRPFKNLKKANQWLRAFWKVRAPQEDEFLSRESVLPGKSSSQ